MSTMEAKTKALASLVPVKPITVEQFMGMKKSELLDLTANDMEVVFSHPDFRFEFVVYMNREVVPGKTLVCASGCVAIRQFGFWDETPEWLQFFNTPPGQRLAMISEMVCGIRKEMHEVGLGDSRNDPPVVIQYIRKIADELRECGR